MQPQRYARTALTSAPLAIAAILSSDSTSCVFKVKAQESIIRGLREERALWSQELASQVSDGSQTFSCYFVQSGVSNGR